MYLSSTHFNARSKPFALTVPSDSLETSRVICTAFLISEIFTTITWPQICSATIQAISVDMIDVRLVVLPSAKKTVEVDRFQTRVCARDRSRVAVILAPAILFGDCFIRGINKKNITLNCDNLRYTIYQVNIAIRIWSRHIDLLPQKRSGEVQVIFRLAAQVQP
jgi:hypothetical protein